MNDKSTYSIYLNGELVCETSWPPQAQTAWNRAGRDRDAAQNGGYAVILKDGVLLAKSRPKTKVGLPWPDRNTPESNWHDVVRQIVLLMRDDGMGPRDIADAMTQAGLSTTRARIDALRGSSKGSRTEVVPAELVVMLNALIAARLDE